METTLEKLFIKPDIIDSVDENNTYIGYFDKEANIDDTDKKNCIIKKIEVTGTETKILWASGNNVKFNMIWDERLNYTYNFKKN